MLDLSLSQNQILLGGLLGDSSCSLKDCRIDFSHSEKQYDYLKWKYSHFDVNTVTDIKPQIHRWHTKEYLAYRFTYRKLGKNRHLDDDLFNFLRKNLYSNDGRKKISLKYLNELTPLAIAVWWMDDGSMCLANKNRYGKLSTNGFNYEEHILIQKYFKEKYDIDMHIKQEKNTYFMRINVSNMKKLIKLIYLYVCEIPSMTYKINLNYKNKGCIGKDFLPIYNYIIEHQ